MITVLSIMERPKELLKTLRKGGSTAVTRSWKTASLSMIAGGGDAVRKWVTVALPELPEAERAALVTLQMDSLLTNYDVEFESYPSNELH
jgi:hypothetical protein